MVFGVEEESFLVVSLVFPVSLRLPPTPIMKEEGIATAGQTVSTNNSYVYCLKWYSLLEQPQGFNICQQQVADRRQHSSKG